MKNLLLLIITIFALSCNSQRQNDLSNDEAIKESFNKSEIKDLSKIQRFFDQSIGVTDYTNEKEILKAYSDFFKVNTEIEMASEIKIPFSISAQKDLNNQLDKSFFDEIWIYRETIANNTGDTLTDMELNLSGKFVAFLKKQGLQDKKFENYYKTISLAGDVSPSLVAVIAKNFNDYDIEDPKIRLLIAIHYLTINDNLNKKQ